MHLGRAAHQQELTVVLPRVALDTLEDIGQKRSEYILDLVLFEHLLELDQRLLRVALRVRIDQLKLVGLACHLEAARLVDLIHRHAHTLGRHPTVGAERPRLRLELANLDDILRTGRGGPDGESQRNSKEFQ